MIGIPVRLGLGQRDLAAGQVEVARRDTKEKSNVPLDGIGDYIAELLDEIQQNLFDRAKTYRDAHITKADSLAEMEDILKNKGGFVHAHWDGTTETELEIKERTKATIRCIPLGWPDEAGKCILTGKPSARRVLFARAY
jgi:prolyl-tRNA synthetase